LFVSAVAAVKGTRLLYVHVYTALFEFRVRAVNPLNINLGGCTKAYCAACARLLMPRSYCALFLCAIALADNIEGP
jgi:hypothetical protein